MTKTAYANGVNVMIKEREALAVNNLIFFHAMAEGALQEGNYKEGLERISKAAVKLLEDITGREK